MGLCAHRKDEYFMIMAIVTFILQNLPAIILLVTTIIGLVQNLKNKKKLTDAEVLANINSLVGQAESLYHAGNGDTKLKYVKSMMLQKYPNLNADQVEAMIKASVQVFNDFRDNGQIDGSSK